MKSVSGKNWDELKINKRLIDKVKIDNNFNEIQAKLVTSRSFTEEEMFSIKNNIKLLNPFFNTSDFLLGCDLLHKHILNKNHILVIGDYDVDGCISTSMMVNFIRYSKTKVNFYIPDRFKDGYGASKELVVKLIQKFNPHLIIFLDCGSNSNEALEFIKSRKISSIIIDHHNTKNDFSLSDVFINPKKNTYYSEYNYLCTAFLTYLFLDIYIKKNQLNYSICDHKIYVLLATVADVMPMRKLNRFLALDVLSNFDVNKNFVFLNIFEYLNIKKKLNLDDLGFLIAPILNSAGRIDNANQVVDLFTSNSDSKRMEIIKKICSYNIKRKIIEKRCFDDIDFKKLHNQKGVLFIYKPDIPEGLIGIIASRIKDYFNKPCIVFTRNNNIFKGSARSTYDFNIGEYIHKAINEKLLISGGGHNLAAGIKILKSKIDKFKKFINHSYNIKKDTKFNFYTSKLILNSINKNLLDNINSLEPFGYGNPKPIFLIENIKITNTQILNDKFISFLISTKNKKIKGISFNNIKSDISYEILNSKNSINILARILPNQWNYKTNIQLELIDIIKSH